MCAPVAAAALAVAATTLKTVSAMQQATVQARVADANAAAERNAAQQDQENTRQAALRQYREIARVKGQQQVAAGANGVSLDFGTPADVVSDTNMLGREDIANIYRSGDNALRSHDVNTANYVTQANAARSQRTNALIGGVLDVGSTVLGGASQYQAMQGQFGGRTMTANVDYGGMSVAAKKAGKTAYSSLPGFG